MLLRDLDKTLQETFYGPPDSPLRTVPPDVALNGLQVGRWDKDISRVACSVDAAAETIKRAVAWKADMLFVHHGLYWGHVYPLVGYAYERFRLLFAGDLALYALHLPLDVHGTLGNNAGMVAELGLQDRRPFGEYKGKPIGFAGVLSEPRTVDWVVEKLFGGRSQVLGVLDFGPDMVSSVGIVSGGAPREVEEAIAAGLDLFITGDASHEIYHACLEAGVNVVFGGHYATETWGPRAVADFLSTIDGINATFIDVPTGL